MCHCIMGKPAVNRPTPASSLNSQTEQSLIGRPYAVASRSFYAATRRAVLDVSIVEDPWDSWCVLTLKLMASRDNSTRFIA